MAKNRFHQLKRYIDYPNDPDVSMGPLKSTPVIMTNKDYVVQGPEGTITCNILVYQLTSGEIHHTYSIIRHCSMETQDLQPPQSLSGNSHSYIRHDCIYQNGNQCYEIKSYPWSLIEYLERDFDEEYIFDYLQLVYESLFTH